MAFSRQSPESRPVLLKSYITYTALQSSTILQCDIQLTVVFFILFQRWTEKSLSGMIVLEVDLLSGFSVENTNQLFGDLIKRVESDNGELIIYIDQVKHWIVLD